MLGLFSCGGGSTETTTTESNSTTAEENTTSTQPETVVEEETTTKYTAGEEIYNTTCMACHQTTGEGIEGAFPPLANSDYLLADKNESN